MHGDRTIVIRIGTRKSQLARWQTRHVSELLQSVDPAISCEEVHFETVGDLTLDKPLPEIGGKGLFTQELEDALRAGRIDIAVHSLKDLPTEAVPGLTIGATVKRMDPRDVLISADHASFDALPEGAVIGTSSTRRAAQLLAARPDLATAPIRGNVDSRIRKAMEGQYDAIILAAAGVVRLGLTEHVSEYLPQALMLPAPGQGAIAVQCRDDDTGVLAVLSGVDHRETRHAVTAERAFLEALGGGCSTPVAAFAEVQAGGSLKLIALVASLTGDRIIRVAAEGPADADRELGLDTARDAIAHGAAELLRGG